MPWKARAIINCRMFDDRPHHTDAAAKSVTPATKVRRQAVAHFFGGGEATIEDEPVQGRFHFPGDVGEHGRAYVVDADGRLIAHPDISLVLRNTDMSRLAQVRSARKGSSSEDVREAVDIGGRDVLTAYAPVNPLGWFVFVETPIEEAYAPLYKSIQRTGYVLLGALALAFVAGMFLAGRMVVPIQALRAGAALRRFAALTPR